MSLELKLIKLEELSTAIGLIASIIMLKSSKLSEQIEIQNIAGEKVTPMAVTPSKLTALAVWLLLFCRSITAQIGIIRLKQKTKSLNADEDYSKLIPSIQIATGTSIIFIATVLLALGSIGVLNQEAEITII